MKISIRKSDKRILNVYHQIKKQKHLTIGYLAETFGVNRQTVRRDICFLKEIDHRIVVKVGNFGGVFYVTNERD